MIDKNDLKEKVQNFLQESNIRQINKDPTEISKANSAGNTKI